MQDFFLELVLYRMNRLNLTSCFDCLCDYVGPVLHTLENILNVELRAEPVSYLSVLLRV